MTLWRVSVAALLVIIVIGATWACSVPDCHIDISQRDLQERLSRMFPLKRCAGAACVDLSNPVVLLREGSDRIGLATDIRPSLLQYGRPGKIAFTGKLKYVPSEGAFYLDQIEIETLELQGVPPNYLEVVKSVALALPREHLKSHPIYTFNGSWSKEALAKLLIRDVQVQSGSVHVTYLGLQCAASAPG